MINILSDIVDAGAVSPSGSSGDKPSNNIYQEYDLNNGGWILITVLIIAVFVLLAIVFYLYHKNKENLEIIKNDPDKTISENEKQLLINYRMLNDRDKNTIENTLKAFNEKGQK